MQIVLCCVRIHKDVYTEAIFLHSISNKVLGNTKKNKRLTIEKHIYQTLTLRTKSLKWRKGVRIPVSLPDAVRFVRSSLSCCGFYMPSETRRFAEP